MESIAKVRFSLDSTNENYEEDMEYFDFNNPIFLSLEKRYFMHFNKSVYLKQYDEKYGKHLSKNYALKALTFGDGLEDEYREESSLENEFIKLKSRAVILFDGKEMSLNVMGSYHGSVDRDIRKKSLDASFDFYYSKRERVAVIFDDLVKIRTKMAKKLGYDNYVGLSYTLHDKEYSPSDLKIFRDSLIKYFVPLSAKLRERQRKRIGVDKMMYYDKALQFKTGNPIPKGDTEWILQKALEMFCDISSDTKEFITYMAENELMDLQGRKGKRGGGFSTFFFKYKAPYIFANMKGTGGDVDLLIHEAGHAFKDYLCRNYALDVDMYTTLDTCEIHSFSMEYLTYDYMDLFFGEDTDKFHFKHIQDSVASMLDSSHSDEFQEIIYSNPYLSNDERCNIWNDLTIKYLPGIDNSGNELLSNGLLWQNRVQIFTRPFYAIEYALAQIVAYQFLFKKKENHENAFKEYVEFCKLGGKYTFSESLKIAGLKNPFEDSTVKEMAEKIEELLNSIDDSKF